MSTTHSQSKAVSSLIFRLCKSFSLNWVNDGEERIKLNALMVSSAKRECLDAVTSVDESWISVKNKETGKNSIIFVVLGNDNSEMVCDYSDHDSLLEDVITQHSEYWENKDS